MLAPKGFPQIDVDNEGLVSIMVAFFGNSTTPRFMPTRNRRAAGKSFRLHCQICKATAHPMRPEIVELLHRRGLPAAVLLRELETSKANLSKPYPAALALN
jgi:hypothetical protein